MRVSLLLTCFCTIAVACNGSGDGNPNPSGSVQTVQFQANNDGTLNYCDASGTCSSLPNPDNCKTLTVTIDTGSGQACQVCTTADGNEGAKNCTTPAVECQVITIPDPDCVVCAYVNGTVIFSSCEPAAPICYTTNADGSTSVSGSASAGVSAGSAGAGTTTNASSAVSTSPPVDASGTPIQPRPGCTICIDQNGNRVSQDCPPVCEIACPMIACGPGEQLVTTPGECCPHCEPTNDCKGVMCPMAEIVCPDGQVLTKDPSTCCGWFCQPSVCASNTNQLCPAMEMMTIVDCAPGYVWSTEPPNCCGACVPAKCTSQGDCGSNQICAMPPCACLPDGNGGCSVSPSCVGTCTPQN